MSENRNENILTFIILGLAVFVFVSALLSSSIFFAWLTIIVTLVETGVIVCVEAMVRLGRWGGQQNRDTQAAEPAASVGQNIRSWQYGHWDTLYAFLAYSS